ncbi:cyclin-dependent protein kinase inhibitor SMR3-like [Salvia hispanica]|uniref:cyclin-dependent protein kinase inhibitor SMR3-like n=1 Tax=Salvia hispanica TaxID=49212 RepID=UPI0020099C43|nr:cyclin-dependent protein kinase inhibitor SMR3-like [Salvia hispanica]
MCSEIHQFSPFLRKMSVSSLSFERKAKFSISETTQNGVEEEKGRVNLEIEKKEDESGEAAATVSHDDDEDGFKTPTSSDHRIPPITECPPAPTKPRPPPLRLKRKSSQPAEIESIFRSIATDQDDTQHRKIKKARTDDHDRS